MRAWPRGAALGQSPSGTHDSGVGGQAGLSGLPAHGWDEAIGGRDAEVGDDGVKRRGECPL